MSRIFALSILSLMLFATLAEAGPCVNPSDIAADGSRCGGRASTVRPGGNDGP